MTASPELTAPSPEQGKVELFSAHIERGKLLLAKPEFSPGAVKLWNAGTRHHLYKIYGSNSGVEKYLPSTQDAIAPDRAREVMRNCLERAARLYTAILNAPNKAIEVPKEGRVFIGHGRSAVWRELKDFLTERLHLPFDEFNREAVAGIATTERLQHMLDQATFAILVMTAEDAHGDSTLHARENVIHEVGLFQGRLGARRAIILLENGCAQFSNIFGLTHIPFASGHIRSAFEEVRHVLEREGLVSPA